MWEWLRNQAVCRSWKHCKNFEESVDENFKCFECTIRTILNFVEAGSEDLKEWEKNLVGSCSKGQTFSNTFACGNIESRKYTE